MSGLGEQIAVLDGLGALDPNDGRIGQARPRVDQYAQLKMRDVLTRMNMVQASGGANYSGGSSYFPGGPLMPSSTGLAGGRFFGDIPSQLPPRMNVISPSGGVNYGGGASYSPGLPLLPSVSGLAETLIAGGYGRAGLGSSFIDGGYGRAGLGGTGTYVDEDLAAAAEIMEVARKLDPADGRIGQTRAQVDEYGKPVVPGVLARSHVVDPSEGANYGGGSTYYPGSPLLPSNAGLAGLGACGTCNGMGALSPLTATQRVALMQSFNAHKMGAALEQKRIAIASQGISVASKVALSAAKARLALHIAAMKTIWARLGNKKAPAGAVKLLNKAAANGVRMQRKPAVKTAPGTQQWR